MAARYLLDEKGVPPPREDGAHAWSCLQVATILQVTAHHPHLQRCDALGTVATYAFDPETYPLRDSPIRLSAEDVLMFVIGDTNGYSNSAADPFADCIALADVQAMRGAGLINTEFEFQYRVIPALYAQFVR